LKRFEVVVKQQGMLLSVLEKEFPLLPAAAIRKALKNKDIRVNGAKAAGNQSVQPGDHLLLYTEAQQQEIPIVFENDDCLVINKPAGINTDSGGASSFSLISWARGICEDACSPALVHRLDNQTSGLLVIAKTRQAEEALGLAFRNRQVDREYTCQVLGSPKPPVATMTAWLRKDSPAGRVWVSGHQTAGAKEIITEYAVLEAGQVSRLLVRLHTGRTHQVRAHLAFLGHPLLGDELYGSREANRAHKARSLRLCATGLGFQANCPLPSLRGKRFSIDAPF